MEYGCIGEKLTHSFSKIIHNNLYDNYYELKEISKEDLPKFMEKSDFKAINVTIPYKEAVIPFLDYISDMAKEIGAVNTIVKKDGKLYGYNTDFLGMTDLIEINQISLKDKKVLILGSGGTSKTAWAGAKSQGAKLVLKVSRSEKSGFVTYEKAVKEHNDAQIIINTTPCGMFPNIGKSALEIDGFTKLSAVIDAVYNPLSSDLVVKAKEKGIKAVGGLYMLVSQAVFAAEKFLDKKIPKEETLRIYNQILKDKINLVLIGMPGSGKTTIGKAIAKELSMDFIDSDDEIVKSQGVTIPKIFEDLGEVGFREIESQIIKEISSLQGRVIATGGGAVLNKRNIELLKENGLVVFIDRPLDDIVVTDDRPLSSNRELLKKRYNERYDIYKNSADFVIKTEFDLQRNITTLKEVFLNEIASY